MSKQQQDTATATEKRQTRRYNLGRSDRDFVVSNVLPTFKQQMAQNIEAMDKMLNEGANVISPDVARNMKAQFEAQLERVQHIERILTEGTLANSASDDD